jgi:hypothetical protein
MNKIEILQKYFEIDMEKAQKEFFEVYQNIIANAVVLLKNNLIIVYFFQEEIDFSPKCIK